MHCGSIYVGVWLGTRWISDGFVLRPSECGSTMAASFAGSAYGDG